MRAHEFLTEQNHEQAARDALITIITTNHALGITKIKPVQLAKSLEDRNFFVDADWIKNQLQDIPVVDQDKTTDDQVVLTTSEFGASQPEQSSLPDLDTDTQTSVEKMAKRALAKRSK